MGQFTLLTYEMQVTFLYFTRLLTAWFSTVFVKNTVLIDFRIIFLTEVHYVI